MTSPGSASSSTDEPTALLVVVPEAEKVVGELRQRRDPSAGLGLPAHVTVLYPFVPASRVDGATEQRVRSAIAAIAPFTVRFATTARFPGVLYLAPDPPAPFVALTQALHGAFPEYPPYRGAYPTVIPHLTVATGRAGRWTERAVRRRLPFDATVRRVGLFAIGEGGRWAPRFELQLDDGLGFGR